MLLSYLKPIMSFPTSYDPIRSLDRYKPSNRYPQPDRSGSFMNSPLNSLLFSPDPAPNGIWSSGHSRVLDVTFHRREFPSSFLPGPTSLLLKKDVPRTIPGPSATSSKRLVSQTIALPISYDSVLRLPPSLLEALTAPKDLYDPNSATSNVLIAPIAGRGYLNWNYIKPSVDRFNMRQGQRKTNALNVDWLASKADVDGSRGRATLKSLFLHLNQDVFYAPNSAFKPIASFRSISISVPRLVKDLASRDLLGNLTAEDDTCDLRHAVNLKELSWSGDFVLFTRKFKGVPMFNLTVLKISCPISVGDAIALLHSCPLLEIVVLETLESTETLETGNCMEGSDIETKVLYRLKSLTLTSNTPIRPFFQRIEWRSLKTLDLTLRAGAQPEVVQALSFVNRIVNLRLTSNLPLYTLDALFKMYPSMTHMGY